MCKKTDNFLDSKNTSCGDFFGKIDSKKSSIKQTNIKTFIRDFNNESGLEADGSDCNSGFDQELETYEKNSNNKTQNISRLITGLVKFSSGIKIAPKLIDYANGNCSTTKRTEDQNSYRNLSKDQSAIRQHNSKTPQIDYKNKYKKFANIFHSNLLKKSAMKDITDNNDTMPELRYRKQISYD